jgi:hypothetical protein
MADQQVNTDALRNASPLPDSEPVVDPAPVSVNPPHDDLDDEHQIVHHVIPPPPPPPHQLAWQYTQQVGLHAFLWLQVLWQILSSVASTTQTVSKGVIRSLQAQQYVFFERSNYPYRLQDYSLTGPGVASVDWYYNADTKLFVSSALYNTTTDYTTHHLEWLTGQIRYNSLVLYDISEYLQQVKWAGTARPSAARVMAAWSLHSGIVLSGMDGITLQTINEDGSESVLPYHG